MGKLSTHALDTYRGRPAANLGLALYHVGKRGELTLIKTLSTNMDGRTDLPLLSGNELIVGVYQIEFNVGAYFAQAHVALPSPAFLDVVPVRIGISEPNEAFHVPLLFTPWAYSTYRGS
jgi:5-hydroxyisourate hydrolase